MGTTINNLAECFAALEKNEPIRDPLFVVGICDSALKTIEESGALNFRPELRKRIARARRAVGLLIAEKPDA